MSSISIQGGSFPQKTKAAVLYEQNQPLVIEELTLPSELKAGQVLVKVDSAGLCHSQLNEIQGKKGPDRFLPHTLGHEASGKVLAIGPGGSRLKEEDSVVLSWIKGPGLASEGPQYKNSEGKTINAGPVAAFSEYAIVSENRCTPIKTDLPSSSLALLGCAIPTGAGVVIHQLRARPGESVVIFGAGGVGLSAILAAELLHCSPIIAIDIQDEKLEFAKTLGATHVYRYSDSSKEEILQSIQKMTSGGPDYVIEASGARSAMELGYEMVRPQGGQLVIAGNLPKGQQIQIDPFSLILEKQITGTAGGSTEPSRDLPRYAVLNQQGKFPFDRLVTQSFSLDQINDAFRALENGAVGRMMIQFK